MNINSTRISLAGSKLTRLRSVALRFVFLILKFLDHGRLFWGKTSDDFVALNQTLCWRPTSGPPDIAIGDPINETYVQLSPVEFAFCGISYEIKLHEDVFVGSMIQSYAGSSKVGPYGDPNTIHIGSLGLDKIMSNVAKYTNKEALRINGSDVYGKVYVTEVFVEAQWPWLILPTILVVCGTIFIAMVIIENKGVEGACGSRLC
ncbi:unnamed protein product [Penicillium bialowiezense]